MIWQKIPGNQAQCQYLAGKEEYLAYSRNICDLIGLEALLHQNQGLLLHASPFIRWQGGRILFSASLRYREITQANLWVQHQGAEVINGDRAALRRVGAAGRPLACLMPVPPEFTATNPSPFPPWWSFVGEGKPFAQPNQGRPSPAFFPEVTVHRWDPDFVQDTMDTLLAALDALLCTSWNAALTGAVELLREQMQP